MQNQILTYLKNNFYDYKVILTDSLLKKFPATWSHINNNNLLRYGDKNSPSSHNKIFFVFDFSAFEMHEDLVDLSFIDLLNKRKHFECPLSILNYVHFLLKEGGFLKILPLGLNPKVNTITKFLRCAKFDVISVEGNIITARKRKLKKYLFDHEQLTFEETNSPEVIRNIQYFAKGLFKNYNFDLSIDDLFTPHSDFFVCYKTKTREIVAFLRYTWHLPKYPLPCMLAEKTDDRKHLKLDNPEVEIYGEIFAPYINCISAVKSYKELIKNILEHCLSIGATKVFTTYDKSDPMSGEFFKRVFGLKDTGVVLRYGDFGGEWGLLAGGKDDIIPVVENFIKRRSL
jgi:hypothetical protein